MPITEIQSTRRSQHLGSSDMAAVLGVDRFRNAYDVWLEKTNKVEPLEETEVMRAGTMFEDGVLKYAEHQLGPLVRNQYRSLPAAHLGSNIDAILKIEPIPVEAKTAGLFGPLMDHWGADGSDDVPERVIIQSHVHMICLESLIAQPHGDTFIEQDLHAAVSVRRLRASSKPWIACSRVTDGKSSRNSSSV